MKRYNYKCKGKELNYGLNRRGTKTYRNALRSCKLNQKLYGAGFDFTEIWNLDLTFYKFIYKNGINSSRFLVSLIYSKDYEYIRKLYNIENPYEQNDLKKKAEIYEKEDECRNIEREKLKNEILKKLSENPDLNERVCNFLVPRLKAFKAETIGYPCKYDTFDNWSNYIQECIDEIEQNRTFIKFYEEINAFW